MYLGIITLSAFLLTALIGVLIIKGIGRISFKLHLVMATIAITLAIIHGILGISAYF